MPVGRKEPPITFHIAEPACFTGDITIIGITARSRSLRQPIIGAGGLHLERSFACQAIEPSEHVANVVKGLAVPGTRFA